jgi:hypothetical protein
MKDTLFMHHTITLEILCAAGDKHGACRAISMQPLHRYAIKEKHQSYGYLLTLEMLLESASSCFSVFVNRDA